VLVTWNQIVGTTATCRRAFSLDNGATWSAAATLVSNVSQRPDADVDVDGAGTACVAFRLYASAGPGGTPIPVRVLSGAVNSSFSTVVTLASGGVAGPPAVAADATGAMLVAYTLAPVGGGLTDVHTQRSTDGGATFAAAVNVTQSAVGGPVPRSPSVALRGTTALLSWLADGTNGQGYPVTDVHAGRSSDGGATWSVGAPTLPGLAHATRSGLGAAVSGNGALTVAWAESRPGATPEVYSARSIDGGTSWASLVARSGTPGASTSPSVAAGSGALVLHAFADGAASGGTWTVKAY
jgi:hypothetical protein